MKSAAMALALAMLLAGGGVCAHAADASSLPGSGIKGRVHLENDAAAAGVYVYAYDSAYNDMRTTTKLVSAATAADGSYTLNLAPATYYVVARKRTSGEATGALGEGDLEGRYPTNPVTVKAGDFTSVDLTIAEVPGIFLLSPLVDAKSDMPISGRVVNDQGSPVAGAYVMLYANKDRIGRPTFLSRPTNEKGEYTIHPTRAGTYYVVTRNKYGGLPRKGEPYGTYDQNPEHKIVVQEKTAQSGIDMTLTRFTRDLTKCAEH